TCRRASSRARLRGPALGGQRFARLRRRAPRSRQRRAASGRGNSATGAARTPARLGGREAERAHDLATAFVRERDDTTGRCDARAAGGLGRGARGAARAHRRQPALRGAVLSHAGRARPARGAAGGPAGEHWGAAGLDALAEVEKQLLQDAAVVGKVFWPGALEAVGGISRRDAEALLQALVRREVGQRARRSSGAGDVGE